MRWIVMRSTLAGRVQTQKASWTTSTQFDLQGRPDRARQNLVPGSGSHGGLRDWHRAGHAWYAPRTAPPSHGDLVKEFCPQCGSARAGAFRYCLGCRLDFDSLGPDSSGPVAVVPTAKLVQAGPVIANSTGARQLTLRGLLAAGLAILIGLTGSVTGISSTAPESAAATPTTTGALFVAAIPSPTARPPAVADLRSGPTGPTTEASVVRVIDGATIVVAFADAQYQVRYIGMEPAGASDASIPAGSGGTQALAGNTALVAGKIVVLEKDVSDADQSGRLLRYVWLTDRVTWTLRT